MSSEKPLLKPIKIGDLEVKNRVVMAPMNMNFTGPNHYPGKQQAAYYAARAAGGTGLIVVEAMGGTWHPTADTYRKYNNLSVADERYVPYLANFVEHIKSFGAKVFAQVSIGPGRQGTTDLGAVQPVSASPIPFQVHPDKIINGLGSAVNMKPLHALTRVMGYYGKISKNSWKAFEQIKNV
ncbi:MAG: hypothetical protein EHM12_02625, partial [Dehalococcoidia bacterium]